MGWSDEDDSEFEEDESEQEFVTVEVAVITQVNPEQIVEALRRALDNDGDLAGYEIAGVKHLPDGTAAVVAEVAVESGMAAMEWQRYLSQGFLNVDLTLPVVEAFTLQFAPRDSNPDREP